jgi:hypothetical protein
MASSVPSTTRPMNRLRPYFVDCEFDGHDGPLLSIALVTSTGPTDSLYIKVNDVRPKDPWVIKNVVPILDSHNCDVTETVPLNHVGSVIRRWTNGLKNAVIVADSPVDIGRFCRAITTGTDGGWKSAKISTLRLQVINVDTYPTTVAGAVQHNAWWDAVALWHAIRKRQQAQSQRIRSNS